MLAMLAVLLTAMVSCGEKERPVAESAVVGIWSFPLTAGQDVFDLIGKKLIISADHTAMLAHVPFSNWKLDGYNLTMSNYTPGSQRLEMLQYTIDAITDSTLGLSGRYFIAVGDSILVETDMSGLYKGCKPTAN